MSLLNKGGEGLRPAIRSPQNFVAGAFLVLAAAFVVFMLSGLPQGTLRAMGPAMVPRWTAIGIGLGGAVLVVLSFLKEGEALERWQLRGPFFVLASLILFAVTIRSVGFLVAAPLAMFTAGFGSREVRPIELAIFTVAMTVFCAVVFRVVLNQPLPMLILPALSIQF
ncbi:tripartite tricarboxylate transporter TctB family protein [Ancylobacter sonchi]|uniref:tripartite tricarboxylate transporter TctB family protein n=1 Tax=Ancylobacter sonchi TaxID=1937790 RepID=UPI001BD68D88|nr:tripartite tricarboxylate transporter TctB family protein [Ancylobacter sonchi]MBS7534527.1 tripartite tricarboxylate transporter TctB family protein [Ancylobacter sonchi]